MRQFDPLLPFKIGPMNGREGRLSRLRPTGIGWAIAGQSIIRPGQPFILVQCSLGRTAGRPQQPEEELLRPLASGSLRVEQVR